MVSQLQMGRRNWKTTWPFLKRSFKYPAGIHASISGGVAAIFKLSEIGQILEWMGMRQSST